MVDPPRGRHEHLLKQADKSIQDGRPDLAFNLVGPPPGLSLVIPSIGSRGHPNGCEKPCKFVWKVRGCHDGANCLRCHLCKPVKPPFWPTVPTEGPLLSTVPAAVDGNTFTHLSQVSKSFFQSKFAKEGSTADTDSTKDPSTEETDSTKEVSSPEGPPDAESLVPPPPEASAPRLTKAQRRWSVGSTGHPHSCSEPCKYNVKKAGCKDGKLCSRCHICRWKRSLGR